MNLLKLFFMGLFSVCSSSVVSSQVEEFDVNFGTKLISFRQARLSVGIGYETAFVIEKEDGKTNPLFHKFIGSNKELTLEHQADVKPYYGFNLSFDLYAPNSFIGLFAELKYSVTEFDIAISDNVTDKYISSLLDIPLYLKLRPGKIESQHHLLIMAGGSYSIPLSIKHETAGVVDESLGQIKNSFSVGGMVGYEYYAGKFISKNGSVNKNPDRYRAIIYSRINYRLNSPFNHEYSERIVSTIENAELDFKDLFITFGVSIFYKLNGAK